MPAITSKTGLVVAVLSVIGMVFHLLIPVESHAGGGRLRVVDGVGIFDLTVTLNWQASEAEIELVQTRLRQASRLIYDATDGKFRLGTIQLFNNRRGYAYADLIVVDNVGWASADARIGCFGESVVLFTCDEIYPQGTDDRHNTGDRAWISCLVSSQVCSDSDADADNRYVKSVQARLEDTWQTIAHEISHYVFDLRDEYKDKEGINGQGRCQEITHGDTTSIACLMDQFKCQTWEHATEYCWSVNHGEENLQHKTHEQSCWETIAAKYDFVSAPDGPEGEAPDHVDPSDPNEYVPAPGAKYRDPVFPDDTTGPNLVQVVFVLDVSANMNEAGGNGLPRIMNLQSTVSGYLDGMMSISARDSSDVEVGIVSYDSAASRLFGLAPLTNTNGARAKNVVDDLEADGSANMVAGIVEARNLLNSDAVNAVKVVVILTDTHDDLPTNLVWELVEDGIRVFVIAVRDGSNECPVLQTVISRSESAQK